MFKDKNDEIDISTINDSLINCMILKILTLCQEDSAFSNLSIDERFLVFNSLAHMYGMRVSLPEEEN